MPTHREGTCPFCGKHETDLTLRIGFDREEEKLQVEWCCAKCNLALDELRKVMADGMRVSR